MDNNSSIPPNITFETEQKLSTFEFCPYIIKIIKLLDPNKNKNCLLLNSVQILSRLLNCWIQIRFLNT